MTATIEAAIQADERRAARDSHRAAGGSKRRPLKSFMTQAEKREARETHSARLKLAVEELGTEGGFAAWLEALELNPHLSPMNAALVALQTPGEIVASSAGWRRQGYRVRKGERLAGRITAPGFWPLPYFTAAQANAGDVMTMAEAMPYSLPDRALVRSLEGDLAERLTAGEKARIALEAVAERARANV